MHVEIVVNPIHRDAPPVCERVRHLCRRHHASSRVRTTSRARPAGGADFAGADLVAVVGGDGTLREVAGRMASAGGLGGQPPILAVPTGTADLFAHNLGFRSAASACAALDEVLIAMRLGGGGTSRDVMLGERVRTCDLGWARLTRAQGRSTPELPFLVTAGMGHSATAIMRTPSAAKRLLGPLGYGAGALATLAAEAFDLSVEAQPVHRTVPSVPLWSIEFGNIQRIPCGITVFPHGGVKTGTLAMLGVRGPEEGVGEGVGVGRRWGHLGGVGTLRSPSPADWCDVFRAGFLGGHDEVEALTLAAVSRAHASATGDRPVPVHLDGEAAGWATELDVRVEPAALRMVAPLRAA